MPRWAAHTWIIVGGAPFVAECLFSGLQDHDILLVNRKGDQAPLESQSKISFFLTLPNRTRYFGEVLQSVYFSAKRDGNTYTLLNQKLLFSPLLSAWFCMSLRALFCWFICTPGDVVIHHVPTDIRTSRGEKLRNVFSHTRVHICLGACTHENVCCNVSKREGKA